MGDSTTIALHLTFFGTLGLAFLMFLGLFLLVVLTLVIAGIGRLAALFVMALFGRLPRNETLPLVRLSGASRQGPHTASSSETPLHDDGVAPAPGKRRDWRKAVSKGRNLIKPSELRPRLHGEVEHHPLLAAARREPPVLAEDWAAAVAEADARAMARARAAAPEITISVRDLPEPGVPAEKIVAVAPLVESALHQDRPARDVPRSFKKPASPAPLSPLDTGSLVSLSAHSTLLKGKLPADRP